MTHRFLSENLVCPDCRAPVETRDEAELLTCPGCGQKFAFRSRIPSMLSGGTEALAERAELELSVFIMAMNEAGNIGRMLGEMLSVLKDLNVSHEVVVIDGNSTDATVETAESFGARVYLQERPGYANGFREGLQRCRGRYILTFDADGSHDPNYIRVLWQHRERAELVVGSRYISRGEAWMPLSRTILSSALNRFMTGVLAIPLKDVSSGFRLYRRAALKRIELEGRDFDILIELLVKMVLRGYRVLEVPFLYKPRLEGVSNARLFRFAVSYSLAAWRLLRIRNKVNVADYDGRAYHSRLLPQRFWQRRRYDLVTRMLGGAYSGILDVGCGSSKIIQSLPGAVGVDLSLPKLRHIRTTNPLLVHADVRRLPFRDESFEHVVCSQMLDQLPQTEEALQEMLRVLKPGGRLILGIADSDSRRWRWISPLYDRVVPGGRGAGITLRSSALVKQLQEMGAELEDEDTIFKAEWIGAFRKTT